MLATRFVALTAACSLISLPATASPYRMLASTPGYAPPGGSVEYVPAGTHEVIVQTAPAPAPAPPPVVTDTVVVTGQPVEPYADPTLTGPTTTTVIVAPPPAPTPPPMLTAPLRRPPPPRGIGLMVAGWSIFGTTYLLTAFTGAALHDAARSCDRPASECRRMGASLMIPLVGPALAARDSDSASGTMGLFLLSGIQLATFIMGVAGAVRHARYKRWQRDMAGLPLGRSGLALQPMPRFDGGGVGLNYRF